MVCCRKSLRSMRRASMAVMHLGKWSSDATTSDAESINNNTATPAMNRLDVPHFRQRSLSVNIPRRKRSSLSIDITSLNRSSVSGSLQSRPNMSSLNDSKYDNNHNNNNDHLKISVPVSNHCIIIMLPTLP